MELLKLNIQLFASSEATGGTSSSSWNCKIYVVENSTNVSSNTSSVTVIAYVGRPSSGSYFYGMSGSITFSMTGCNNQSVSISNLSANVGAGGYAEIGRTTFNSVPHNSDGSKSVTAGMSFSTNVSPSSGSASVGLTLTKIPRASSISCTGGNIGEETTINISRASSSFTHTINYSFEGLTGTIATKTNQTSLTWTIPEEFYEKIPNSNSGTVTLTCITYSGNTNVGSKTTTFTTNVTNANPIFTDFTYKDINTVTKSLTNEETLAIQGYSNIQQIISTSNKAEAIKSATMSYYKFGDLNTEEYSDTNEVTHTIQNISTNNLTAIAYDSRGNNTTVNKTITLIPYNAPHILNVGTIREDGIKEKTYLTFEGTLYNGNFNTNRANEVTYFGYRTKQKDSEEWSNWFNVTSTFKTKTSEQTIDNLTLNESDEFTIHSNGTSGGFTQGIAYDIEVKISDGYSTIIFNSDTSKTIVEDGKFLDSYAKTSTGYQYGINQLVDTSLEDGLQVEGMIYLNGEPFTGGDSLPLGTIVEYDGTDVPDGYEEVTDYSTSEVKTGENWIDGKPIYRKVVVVNNPTITGTYVNVAHNISNISEIWLEKCFMAQSDNNSFITASEYRDSSTYTRFTITKTYIQYNVKWSNVNKITFVLEYTKTTD